MITINKDELKTLEKYYQYNPNQQTIDNLVDELADILEKSSGCNIGIYQDMDDTFYYRLYAGCSAVEVYVENNIIQIDFDIGWQLNSFNTNFSNEILGF